MQDNAEKDVLAEVQVLRDENTKLRRQLAALGLELGEASDRSADQIRQILDMSVQANADAAQILSQSNELDIARQAVALQSELEAMNKELETFSYSVSHDLRSPLRAINGFAKALSEDFGHLLPPEAKRYLDHIENSAVKMGNLIDDLLAFSRLSRLELTKSDVDMNSLAHSVWNEVLADWPNREIVFHSQSLPKVQGDKALLKQVLLNLFQNAAKFTAPRAVAHVQITAKDDTDATVFCVHDDGVGFDTRYSDKLFGPFQRLHKAKDFSGTGIGLALVQRIVHRHGGKVWAESTLGESASFYFTIPTDKEKQNIHDRD